MHECHEAAVRVDAKLNDMLTDHPALWLAGTDLLALAIIIWGVNK